MGKGEGGDPICYPPALIPVHAPPHPMGMGQVRPPPGALRCEGTGSEDSPPTPKILPEVTTYGGWRAGPVDQFFQEYPQRGRECRGGGVFLSLPCVGLPISGRINISNHWVHGVSGRRLLNCSGVLHVPNPVTGGMHGGF